MVVMYFICFLIVTSVFTLEVQREKTGDIIFTQNCQEIPGSVKHGSNCKCEKGHETIFRKPGHQYECLPRHEIGSDCITSKEIIDDTVIGTVDSYGIIDLNATCIPSDFEYDESQTQIEANLISLNSNVTRNIKACAVYRYERNTLEIWVEIDHYNKKKITLLGQLIRISYECSGQSICVLGKVTGKLHLPDENPDEGLTTNSKTTQSNNNIGIILGVLGGCCLLLIISLFFWCRRKNKEKKFSRDVTNTSSTPISQETPAGNCPYENPVFQLYHEKDHEENQLESEKRPETYPNNSETNVLDSITISTGDCEKKSTTMNQTNPLNLTLKPHAQHCKPPPHQKKISESNDNYLQCRPYLSSDTSSLMDPADDLYANNNRSVILSVRSDDSIFVETGIEYEEPINRDSQVSDDPVYQETVPDVYAQVQKPQKYTEDLYLNKF